MNARKWLAGWLAIVLCLLCAAGVWVYRVDPYFHFHEPETDTYFYSLDNERSQNDGITRYFHYNAMITGTSMTENFKTSEMDEIFGVESIKVPYSGGSYCEINNSIATALKYNPNLTVVVRGLDYGMLLDDKDRMREDLGTYPTYLYDNNPFNDVNYLFNKDVIFNRVYAMTEQTNSAGFEPGVTSFDTYACWQYANTFGAGTVLSGGAAESDAGEPVHLSEDEKQTVYGTITQNVTALADRYPDVDFYYFITPYGAAYWNRQVNMGTVYRMIEAEQYAIELILPHTNIHLYSFNNRTDIVTDLNNYKDSTHYGQWINTMILKWMKNGDYLLTEENYTAYIQQELEFYTTYDYSSLNTQVDYEDDDYAAALWNRELTGAEPVNLLTDCADEIELSGGVIAEDGTQGCAVLQCPGCRQQSENPAGETGTKLEIDALGGHRYLTFYAKAETGDIRPCVSVVDADGETAAKSEASDAQCDGQWHQYVLDLSGTDGGVTVIFTGGTSDGAEDVDSCCSFRDIILY